MTSQNGLLIFLWKETHSETKSWKSSVIVTKKNNNNGKPWKTSRILRVKPNFFIFLSFFIIFLHFSIFFIFSFLFEHFFFFFVFFMFFIFVVFLKNICPFFTCFYFSHFSSCFASFSVPRVLACVCCHSISAPARFRSRRTSFTTCHLVYSKREHVIVIDIAVREHVVHQTRKLTHAHGTNS